MKYKRGFTLIELLVVIAIIALLTTIGIIAFVNVRIKSRDTKRLEDIVQIQKALEMYYQDNSHYPNVGNGGYAYWPVATNPSCGVRWCTLETALAPYIQSLPRDPSGSDQTIYRYYYDSDSGDNYQSYGMMLRLESSANKPKVAQDGGYAGYANVSGGAYYEVGEKPRYCMGNPPGYTGTGRIWWTNAATHVEGGTYNTVCRAGN